ncbi:hypothetical protein ALC60_10779 [Trachymyrmex zeteki]|uniref:THAP-type domain-containing protein n=1 Tax=Mycetomoellerius zeteki TaxID=64791 RepID=A0A151WQJ6_9HYME|nr:PREDICTED: THAP domain-containing protein 2-like [Trachymyrmex zeteki]KYQ50136.1 hypothetical protein ALC60_10779 [Trachymyrmex zeteki]
MPNCYIKNCKNCIRTENIKFFQFPKDPVIRQQWLKACRKNKSEITKSATICNLHFDENCFHMVWTKSRYKNIPAKQIWQIKENSIPTKLLNLEKKRTHKNIVHTGIPIYGELVQYMREKQHIHSEQTNSAVTNICEDNSAVIKQISVKIILQL